MDSAGNYSSPGFYSTGQLTLKLTMDEQGQTVKEFTDKSGHVICKRVIITSDSLQTYYIYDNLDMLRAVIQPEGLVALKQNSWTYPTNFAKNWMFLYRYDERGRMVMKKVPGADSVIMLYDVWDRLVLFQDAVERVHSIWDYTKYDQLNRPAVTGEITDTRARSAIQADITGQANRFESVSTSVGYGYTLNNTFPSSSSYTLGFYTFTHYDTYDNLPSWKSNYAYVNEDGVAAQNLFVNGQVIATQTIVLNHSNYVLNVNYFDDKYRLVQSTADNNDGGKDRVTKILSFDGKVTSDYRTHTSRFFTTGHALVIKQTYSYDHVDRLLQVTHQTASQETVTLTQNSYNEVGQLLNKKLHQSTSHPSPLQNLDYYYNIRGWLNSVNKPTPGTTGYDESDLFSFELHYNSTILQNATAQYNGNIAEEVWKSGYDEYLRGYQYHYDKANRLNSANYWLYSSSSWASTSKYDESSLTYDHNGNILTLGRYHGDGTQINNLTYSGWSGNQLGKVTDQINNTSPVGFHDRNNGSNNDYTYDANGNMTSDYNKNITSIDYDHLNLPQTVKILGKGTIAYTWDAVGNKVQKTITDSTVTPVKVTNYYYAGDFEYRNDTLEYITHPEGRLRPVRIDTTQPISTTNLKYIYDYFMKDHLGSVRSVLTTEQETDVYAATMESANATKENQLFSNISSTTTAKPGGFDTDNNNQQVSVLNGNVNVTGNKRVGPSIVLKVMAGDTISVSTYAWYTGTVQPPATGVPAIINDILPLLTGGVVADNGTHGGSISQTNINGWLSTVLTNFLSNTQTYDNTRPKAFLNWVVVDEEFNAVSSANHLGAVQIPAISGGTQKQPLVGPANMVIRRNGYLYIYVSNEANQNIYFDDLVINHKRGPLTEQKDYYAFGLEIPGLSTQAFKPNYFPNKYKYVDKLLDDDLSLNWYQFKFRNYDPQIARFVEIDPLGAKYVHNSTYDYAEDRPISGVDLEGLEYSESITSDNNQATKINININVKVVNSTSDMSDKRVMEIMNSAKNQMETNLFKGKNAEGADVSTTLNFSLVPKDKINESKDFFVEFVDITDKGLENGYTKEIGNTDVNKFQVLSEGVWKELGFTDEKGNTESMGKTVAHELGHGGGLRHADDDKNPKEVINSMGPNNFMRAEANKPYVSSSQQLSVISKTIEDNKKKSSENEK
jgi:RHS repeat-associated protein